MPGARSLVCRASVYLTPINDMKYSNQIIVATGILGALLLAGCGGPEAPTLTAEQEAAARHPVVDPNYKGPSKEGLDKMNQSIADYQQKHANDKIEFNTK